MTDDDTGGIRGYSIDRRTFLRSTGVATAALTLGGTSVAAQQSGSDVSRTDHVIESWDGTQLATTYFTPAADSPQPAVLMTHGWGGNRQMEFANAERYAENGYAVLAYDSRGFGESEGTVSLNGPNEVRDGQHLIDWLADRDEVAVADEGNPHLGMDGYSYGGGIQLLLAANDDRVDAINPRITWNDLQYSLVPNGVIKSGWINALLEGGEAGLSPSGQLDQRLYDYYEEALETNDVPVGLPEFSEERSFSHNYDGFDTPTFIFQGWDDDLFNPNEGTWTYETLQELGVPSRICFHRGGHVLFGGGGVSASEKAYMDDLAMAWLDRHLRGADNTIAQAHMWDGQNSRWVRDDAFPPADVGMVRYELDDADTGWRHRNRIQRDHWRYETWTEYPWTVDSRTELYGTPKIDLSLQAHGPEAIVFVVLRHNNQALHNYGECYRVRGSGIHQAQFDYPALHRILEAGDTILLDVAVVKGNYEESQVSEGVTIRPADSAVNLPVRDQATGPGSDTGDTSGSGSGGWFGGSGTSGTSGTSGSTGAGSGWW